VDAGQTGRRTLSGERCSRQSDRISICASIETHIISNLGLSVADGETHGVIVHLVKKDDFW
jgi:hypothetical protein